MLNQQIISPEILPLQPAQTVEYALKEMEKNDLLHLPVVQDNHFLGLLSEDDLLDADPQQPLSSLADHLMPMAAVADEFFFSAVRMIANHNLSAVAVVADGNEFVGTITRSQLFMQLVNNLGLQSPGALIVLHMEPHQFFISELSKLIETNDAHITQLNTNIDETTSMLTVTIRINKQNVSAIIATLQRYDYHVEYYTGEEHYENELRYNYNHLMNFLTI